MKIQRIYFVHEIDTDPDLSHLGKYTDKPDPWVIVRRDGDYLCRLEEKFRDPSGETAYELPPRGREFRFFKPDAGEPDGTEDYQRYGLQQYRMMEAYERQEWCMLGVWAEAEIVIHGVCQKIRSGGIWGIQNDDDSQIKDVQEEELHALHAILTELDPGLTPEVLGTFKPKVVDR